MNINILKRLREQKQREIEVLPPTPFNGSSVIDVKQPINADATKEEFMNMKGQKIVYTVQVPLLESSEFHKMLTEKVRYCVTDRCVKGEDKEKSYNLTIEVMEKDSTALHDFLIEGKDKYVIVNIENKEEN